MSALAQRSKAHWGYDATFLEVVRPTLTFSAEDVADGEFWVLENVDGQIIGFHRVMPGDPAELEDLWVEPDAMGAGHGRQLFEHACAVARSGGPMAMEIDADPNAVAFYERMGARRIGETPSTLIPGRALPRMRIDLAIDPQPIDRRHEA